MGDEIKDASTIGFAHPGESCKPGESGFYNVADGKPLSCTATGPVFAVPGDEDELDRLAARLGRGGLSATDRRQIQQRWDEIIPTLPPDRRPYPKWKAVWSVRLTRLGTKMVAVSIPCIAVLWHREVGMIAARIRDNASLRRTHRRLMWPPLSARATPDQKSEQGPTHSNEPSE
nr:hypothetical protein GCM10010200_048600 [Actinomadura rugatobispora]